MAQRVVHVEPIRGRNPDQVMAMLARFPGDRLEARGVSARDADAIYQWMRAAKRRLPIRRVTAHVCRHDEGVGACTIDHEA